MNNCIFCKIIKKEIPASIIYEDNKTLAFLDIAPAQPKGGHVLVIPKNHSEIISEMNDEDAKALMLTIKKVSQALMKFGQGMNIVQNNKELAGQIVPHVHFHLIPRFKDDKFRVAKWENNKYASSQEMEKVATQIRNLLKG